MSVLGTGVGARSPPPFHGPQESGGPGSGPGYSRLRPVLAITALPGLQRLNGTAVPPALSRGVGDGACVAAEPTPAAREY